MLNSYNVNSAENEPKHKEGELYRVIEAHGRHFEIYYGYYDEMDRQNPSLPPLEMYPDFKQKPIFTEEGIPFVTAMQAICEYYLGDGDEDNTCYQCNHFEKCEELLGVCKCPSRRNRS